MREIDRISPEVLCAFEQKGFSVQDSIAYALSDVDAQGVRTDCSLLLTADGIAVMSGTTTLRAAGKTITGKGERAYREIAYAFYPLDEIENLRVEEQVSTLRLVAKKGDQYTLLCGGSFTVKDSLVTLCRLFDALKGGRPLPEENQADSKYCPRCGRRYADVDRKICPHCMDKAALIKKMWFFLSRYKFSVAAILLTLTLSSALSILAPYLSSGFYFDQVLSEDGAFYGQLLLVIGLIVVTRLLNTFVSIGNGIVTARVSNNLVCDLRKVIFSSIERLSVSFFSGRQTGGLMSQVDNDSEAIYWLFCDGLPYYIINIVQIVAVLVLMTVINPVLTLLSVITIPPALFVYVRLFHHSRKLHAKRWTKRRIMTGVLADSLSGVRVVKAFAKEKQEVDRFSRVNRERMLADREASIYNATAFPLASLLMRMSLFLAWGFGGWFVAHGMMGLSYGILLTFIAYIGIMTSPLFTLADMTFQFSNCLNSIQRMAEIMDAIPDVPEPVDPVPLSECKGSVRFDDVSFSYVKNRTVIDHMSFEVPAGGKIGIVGHTGAGKSTIANLILRLYDAEEGSVSIDGINVRRLPFADLRKNIAIVSQETYLFYGSIFENIRYARPDATYEEVIAAAKTAGAHDFIVKLDNGYDTMIGFGYRDLSGGERQRVSIARALLHDPKILILDEATSAMDTETEMKIQKALDKLSKGRTTITIAHRLSTLRGSDELYVIEDGKICERGTHEQLLAKEGVYHRLYTLQAEALKNIVLED